MNEIICPHCGKSFELDNSGYADIMNQVRTKEFDKEVHKQVEMLEENRRKEVELKLSEAKAEKDDEINKLNIELAKAKAEIGQKELEFDNKVQKAVAEKESEIVKLEEKLKNLAESAAANQTAEVGKAVSAKNDEISKLNIELAKAKAEIEQKELEFDNQVQKAVAEKESEIVKLEEKLKNLAESAAANQTAEVGKAVSEKNDEISRLNIELERAKAAIEQKDADKTIAVNDALNAEREKYDKLLSDAERELSSKREEILRLNMEKDNAAAKNELQLKTAVSEVENRLIAQKAEYEAKFKLQQESIDYYKDLKTKMSTKMIGETLEQHCENSFNMIRATAFRNAEFGKDNDVKEGSKGDYIYREKDENGNELISIMFEMKNEMDTTATKHKNEDFFAKLDKDRKNKKCEYAVLVSMLEADSELYNQGIVDVSYDFEKMYVIRPQFFIPMITVLRNAALNSMEYKRLLAEKMNQEIDITHFEERIDKFKTDFSRNYNLAGKQFNTAIEEIDKTIDHLNKVKDNLQKSLNNLRLANDKAQSQLTIKSLAKDNPTMINMFDELDNEE